MDIKIWVTIGVLAVVLGLLVFIRRSPDLVIWGGVGLLLLVPLPGDDNTWTLGLLTAPEALAGLANEGVVTIAVLYVVVAGITQTGA